jgi:phage repressor protein C with HTH and peptisase S24 domain
LALNRTQKSSFSVAPSIPDDSTLLVYTSVNTFKQDGIYVVRMDGHLFAKRLQSGPGGALLVISDNSRYSPVTISRDDHDGFQVIGKVVWLGRDF